MKEEKNDFGDFEEVKIEGEKEPEENQQVPQRIFKPRHGQFIGVVLQRLGGNRMSVKSTDGKTRNCRVPGRFKRKFWLRPGDAVIIEPWKDDDDKGDVIYQYKKGQKYHLQKLGMLKGTEEEF